MTVLSEGDITLHVSGERESRRFDDATHALQHCMKAVDFIIEWADRYWFIELKDPQHPAARSRNRAHFSREFLGGRIDHDLQYKYRDTFLYEWAAGRAKKPIYYLVLVAFDTLSSAELMARTDALRRKLPVKGSGAPEWRSAFVSGCAVFNIESWNRTIAGVTASRQS